jgi:8-oxo-dGTP pyrophosphatase MutT (NUDIX family)
MKYLHVDRLRTALEARTPDRATVRPPTREAAVALTLAPDQRSNTSLLLIRRAEHPGDPWSGQIALPGGRRDAADAELRDTAIRETAEETGIQLHPDDLVGELDDLRPVSPHLPPIVVRPFVFAIPSQPPITLSAEVALYLWVPLNELDAARTEEQVQVRGRTLRVPGFRLGPHFLWGMTERIVTSFVTITRDL